MTSFKSIFKVTDGSGNCIQYAEGDIVYKNGEAYITSRTPDLCKSPEHKNSGWEPLTGERSGTTVTFYNSNIPPTRVVQGDEWFNPDTGILYKYIVDATSEQWVQIF